MNTDPEHLFAEHLEEAVRIAGFFRVPGTSADELAQIARLALWEAVCRWRGPSPSFAAFGPYAMAVVRNKLRTAYDAGVRRVRREHVAEPDSPVFACLPDCAPGVRDSVERSDLAARLRACIDTLPERHAHTARAWLATGSLGEFTAALGLEKPGTAGARKSAAVRSLRLAFASP